MDIKKYKEIVYQIIGTAMAVHDELKGGLLEGVYQEALSLELKERGIENKCEDEISIYYKGHLLEKKYRMDIVVDNVVIELKSSRNICSAHRSQLCNYLRLTHKPLGILINFGLSSLQGERWAYNETYNECVLVDKDMNPVSYKDDPFADGTEFIDEKD